MRSLGKQGKDGPEEKKDADGELWGNVEAQAAFLGPNLWDKTLPYDADLKVLNHVCTKTRYGKLTIRLKRRSQVSAIEVFKNSKFFSSPFLFSSSLFLFSFSLIVPPDARRTQYPCKFHYIL